MKNVELMLTISLMVLAGCAPAGPSVELVEISGKVVWSDNKPVAGATINFLPESGGVSSAAITGDDGSFTLSTGTGTSGALVGKHKVTITKPTQAAPDFASQAGREAMMKQRQGMEKGRKNVDQTESAIPGAYGDIKNTPLNYEVKTSASDVVFTIKAQ